ncbi:MAG: YncE family protein, partial [Bacteroidales bacterium]|nr:YncE family protein [Bacteroidales bacterium]
MNTLKKLLNIALVATIIFSSSCSSDDDLQPGDGRPITTGILVLNEGLWGMNNSDITAFEIETGLVEQDVFFRQNGRHLGDTPNDILVYGSKIFITVGGSSTLEITDLQLNSIEQISLIQNNVPRNPRGLASHNGKVYFALFDGYVARLDTASFD